MDRRAGDHDDEDFRPNRHRGGGDWVRWGVGIIISLLIPSLVFVVKLSNREEAVEIKVESLRHDIGAAQERASEDRGMLRLSTDRLTLEIGKLREDLAEERLQRVVDRSKDSHVTFSRGRQFDK